MKLETQLIDFSSLNFLRNHRKKYFFFDSFSVGPKKLSSNWAMIELCVCFQSSDMKIIEIGAKMIIIGIFLNFLCIFGYIPNLRLQKNKCARI